MVDPPSVETKFYTATTQPAMGVNPLRPFHRIFSEMTRLSVELRPVAARTAILAAVLVSSLLISGSSASQTAPGGPAAQWTHARTPQLKISPFSKIGKHTVAEWREMVDAYWGPGSSATEQVQIFDAAWDTLDREYGAYMNLEVDMQALRRRYRQEVRDGVSKGRFAAIMNHLSLAMKDAHTAIMSYSVNWQNRINFDTPLFVLGAWVDNATFGAALTPMPDGSLLVYKALPNHVLGLQPGDLVLGYDGVPWRDLYPQLLAAELPIQLRWVWGSTDQSMEHCMLMSAGMNWHLFNTIDIRKYPTDEIVSLPTSLLVNQQGTLWGNEQLPVAGVEMPDFVNDDYITWGIVDGTRIGYIYVASWSWENRYRISEQW